MPNDKKNIYKQTINNLPLICAAAGGAFGVIEGVSSGDLLPIKEIVIGAGAGAIIGYQGKKTLKNKDKNKTKIGISSTSGVGCIALNLAFNPNPTVINTFEAGAAGIIIGKGSKFVANKGSKYIQKTP